MKPKISLCIISRKEDEIGLQNAISSVSGFIDEVIVVDTSRAQTIEVDDLMGSGGIIKPKVIPFTWTGSFADARNFSFEQATGDVIFWIDSDDIVLHPENLPKLAGLITDGQCDWIYSKYDYHKDQWGNIDATHWKPRLFRKGSVKWVGNVHEDTTPIEGVVQVKDIETGVGTIVIEHKADEEHHQKSIERNLSILLDEVERDGEKTDPRTYQYLGNTLFGMRNYPEAIKYLGLHIDHSGSNSDKYWSLHLLGDSLRFLGKNAQAIAVYMDSLKLFPEWSTGYFGLASIYYELSDWSKVVDWTLVGFDKKTPDILDVISEIDYTILPMARLCEAYIYMNQFDFAMDLAKQMMRINPKMPIVKERYDTVKEAIELENYVNAFLKVANSFRNYDRVKTAKLFDLIPQELDSDARIQATRKMMVPPKTWGDKSVVIYCGDSLEDWAYPSIFTGIGGSETAVINISKELSKLGYSVTVYNRCGTMRGTYNGVEYIPYYHFDPRDTFNTLIGWRNPGIFLEKINAKKRYLWLHDILYPEAINKKIIDNVDKILFLSKWHSKNLEIPEEKIFITNNGIDLKDFEGEKVKKPNSLFWGSSYDRGLLPFIKNILPLIKDQIPDVTLDVAYGWQNIRKEFELLPELKDLYTKLSPILENTPGIIHHNRLSHKKLAELEKSCMVYPYASEFGETNNITSQSCQASGCYVVTTSQAGGTPEYIKFGAVLPGDGIYTDEKLQSQFANIVIDYLKNPKTEYPDMSEFSWESTANKWDKELL